MEPLTLGCEVRESFQQVYCLSLVQNVVVTTVINTLIVWSFFIVFAFSFYSFTSSIDVNMDRTGSYEDFSKVPNKLRIMMLLPMSSPDYVHS